MNQNQDTNLLSIPPSSFVDKLSFVVKTSIENLNWTFACDGTEEGSSEKEYLALSSDEMSSTSGLLPLVMWIAGQSIKDIWGEQDLVFRCDSESLCGVTPELKNPILPPAIWMHAIHFELERAVMLSPQGQYAMLDEWFSKWNQALADRQIKLLPPSPAPSPSASHG